MISAVWITFSLPTITTAASSLLSEPIITLSSFLNIRFFMILARSPGPTLAAQPAAVAYSKRLIFLSMINYFVGSGADVSKYLISSSSNLIPPPIYTLLLFLSLITSSTPADKKKYLKIL